VRWHSHDADVLRIFAIGASYLRYFAYRAFSTSRICYFALALLAQLAAPRAGLGTAVVQQPNGVRDARLRPFLPEFKVAKLTRSTPTPTATFRMLTSRA
jgi:hypothetical protein